MAIDTRDPREFEAKVMQYRADISRQIQELKSTGVMTSEILRLIDPAEYDRLQDMASAPGGPSENMLLAAAVDDLIRKGHFFRLPTKISRIEGLRIDTDPERGNTTLRTETDAEGDGREIGTVDTGRRLLFMELLEAEPYECYPVTLNSNRVSSRGTQTVQRSDYDIFLIPGLERVAFVHNALGEGTYIIPTQGDPHAFLEQLLSVADGVARGIKKAELQEQGAIVVPWNADVDAWKNNILELLTAWPITPPQPRQAVAEEPVRTEKQTVSLFALGMRLGQDIPLDKSGRYREAKKVLAEVLIEHPEWEMYTKQKRMTQDGSVQREVEEHSPLFDEIALRLQSVFDVRKGKVEAPEGWYTARDLAQQIMEHNPGTIGFAAINKYINTAVAPCIIELALTPSYVNTDVTEDIHYETGDEHIRPFLRPGSGKGSGRLIEYFSPELCQKITEHFSNEIKKKETLPEGAIVLNELLSMCSDEMSQKRIPVPDSTTMKLRVKKFLGDKLRSIWVGKKKFYYIPKEVVDDADCMKQLKEAVAEKYRDIPPGAKPVPSLMNELHAERPDIGINTLHPRLYKYIKDVMKYGLKGERLVGYLPKEFCENSEFMTDLRNNVFKDVRPRAPRKKK